MNQSLFFENKGPFELKKLLSEYNGTSNILINDVKNLTESSNQDITFLDSSDYQLAASETKASFCVTTKSLSKYLPKTCTPIIVKNVLFSIAKVAKSFYPQSDIDYPDDSLKNPSAAYRSVKFGNNVLIGKGVKIGQNSIIGNYTSIEKNVQIGDNCIIGSNVHIKNSIIGNNTVIQSGCMIGFKGFGFIPIKGKNFKFPHIGSVLIGSDVEIGTNCTIDRGSLSDTIIQDNTYLDNQVHIAHNVKIGKNCMIAGQVGFAGSTTLGDQVSIGGQAGISGHLKIGNNVKIGGGSGVIKNIADNSVVMGYPAVNFKDFIKNNKKK